MRWAARMSRSVHGLATHSAPQVTLRTEATVAGLAWCCGPAIVSRAVPSGIWTRSGWSIPSVATAASPGLSVTRYRDWAGLRFMVAPTASRSSAAGSRCTILIAVFLVTSATSRAGICSAMMMPSP